jgi:Potential Queuosine, Q, salvage protein family
LLDERAAILRELGAVLLARYDGRFSNVLEASSAALYDGGRGFLEVLVRDFRRFDDVADWEGRDVRFWKLAQLAVWILEVTLPGGLGFRDLDRLTAFADYIVPAALHAMGILRYSVELDAMDRATRADRGRLARGGRAACAHDLRNRASR